MASASLAGKWGSAAVLMIIYYLLTMGVSSLVSLYDQVGGSQLLLYFLFSPIFWGANVVFLEVARGSEVDFSKLFDGYHDFLRIAVTYLLRYVYIILWTLLLIVPGIIKAYSYSMTDYVLKDNPELKNNAAIEKSMAMMEGHKMQLFLLDLSFIGWAILCLFTLGIGFLFLAPYVQTAHAHFYEDLKLEEREPKYDFV